jgi:hypothetical protein
MSHLYAILLIQYCIVMFIILLLYATWFHCRIETTQRLAFLGNIVKQCVGSAVHPRYIVSLDRSVVAIRRQVKSAANIRKMMQQLVIQT